MRISEVVARSGVAATTLRYYETVGLIQATREPNGYRAYDDRIFERLSFIEAAKHMDLSLPQIADLLVVVAGETCTQVREALHPKLTQRLDEVDQHLKTLQALRDRLAVATRDVAACPDSGRSCRSECMHMTKSEPCPEPD